MKTFFYKIALASLLASGCLPMHAQNTYVKVQGRAEAISAPQIVTVSNAVVTVFATNNSTTTGRVILRTVQNTGINPVLYRINSTNVTTTSYHGVLAGGLSTRDGLGSILDLSHISLPVSFKGETTNATTLCIVELTQ